MNSNKYSHSHIKLTKFTCELIHLYFFFLLFKHFDHTKTNPLRFTT